MGTEQGKRQTTPTMTDVLKKAVEQRICDLYTSMPGEITEYDKDTGLATVKPLLKRKYISEEQSVELPLITNVPVCFPRVGKSRLRFPVSAGDEGEIRWQMRSIDIWLKTGGTVDPQDPRKFSISDATFWPGLTSQANKPDLKGDETSSVWNNDKGFIEITPDGKFKMTNGSEEIMDLVSKTLQECIEIAEKLNTTTTNTIFGPMKLNDFAFFGQKKTALSSLKGLWDKLKKG